MKRERVAEAIRHNLTDKVPYNIELTSEELLKVSEYIGIDKGDFFDWAGNHIEKAGFNIGGSYLQPGYYKDEYGVVWDRSRMDKDIGVLNEILLQDPEAGSYSFPQPDIDEIEKAAKKLAGNGRDTFKFGKIGLAYYERAWSLRGMENLLTDFILEPAFVEELFENILQYNMKIIETAIKYDIDGFYFGDDYGQQSGLIMSPGIWQKFIKPGLAKMFDRVKRSGKVVALHSCGNISEIMGDLIDIGLDIYQTVQPEVYDLKKIKTEFGSNLTFWGGISTQRLLPYAKPEGLKTAVKDIMRIMSSNGGYIASPTHQVPADVPPENIAALAEVLKNQTD